MWCYAIQLWGTTNKKIQRRQNSNQRMITTVPWYVKNSKMHINRCETDDKQKI